MDIDGDYSLLYSLPRLETDLKSLDGQLILRFIYLFSPFAGYAANFCDGYCPYPLDAAFNATNHATVQAMLHEKGIKRRGNLLPNPCCVPHEFASLHVLYLDESNVVLKEFDNMVATSCGCH